MSVRYVGLPCHGEAEVEVPAAYIDDSSGADLDLVANLPPTIDVQPTPSSAVQPNLPSTPTPAPL